MQRSRCKEDGQASDVTRQLLRIQIIALTLLLMAAAVGSVAVSALPSYDSPEHPGCSACHVQVSQKTPAASVEPNIVVPGASFHINASIPNPGEGVTGAKLDLPLGFAASNLTQGPAVVDNYSWNVSVSRDVAPGDYWLYAYLVAGTPKAGEEMTAVGSITVKGPADNPISISSLYIDPQFPQPSDSIHANAYISDTGHSITNATLHYRYMGTEYTSPMSVDATNTYIADIGPFTNKTFVDYWVVAHDDGGFAAKSSNRGVLIGQPNRIPDTYLLVSGLVIVDAACVAVLYRVAKKRQEQEPEHKATEQDSGGQDTPDVER